VLAVYEQPSGKADEECGNEYDSVGHIRKGEQRYNPWRR
jgi:hypothetical protein